MVTSTSDIALAMMQLARCPLQSPLAEPSAATTELVEVPSDAFPNTDPLAKIATALLDPVARRLVAVRLAALGSADSRTWYRRLAFGIGRGTILGAVPMMCRPGQAGDLDSWMELAAEVEPLFGPMPGFRDFVLRAIERGTGFVVVDERDVLGAAFLSPGGVVPNRIRWLAVRQATRRAGVGSLLMRAILANRPDGVFEVVTFTGATPGGSPARHFYERFGFKLEGPADPAPDGSARDLFVLAP